MSNNCFDLYRQNLRIKLRIIIKQLKYTQVFKILKLRFLIIAIVLAIKYHDDDIFKNEYYARVGGITMEELNKMEKEFLELLDY